MTKPLFDFDAEFKLGIDAIDQEHIKLVDMLNQVHAFLSENKRAEARQYFVETLANYVDEHFAHEEQFLASIDFPQLTEHQKIHAQFKKSVRDLSTLIESGDDGAFRQALNESFTWIIAHIGKTDKRYAKFYLTKDAETPNAVSVSE
jgi:hemerythrin